MYLRNVDIDVWVGGVQIREGDGDCLPVVAITPISEWFTYTPDGQLFGREDVLKADTQPLGIKKSWRRDFVKRTDEVVRPGGNLSDRGRFAILGWDHLAQGYDFEQDPKKFGWMPNNVRRHLLGMVKKTLRGYKRIEMAISDIVLGGDEQRQDEVKILVRSINTFDNNHHQVYFLHPFGQWFTTSEGGRLLSSEDHRQYRGLHMHAANAEELSMEYIYDTSWRINKCLFEGEILDKRYLQSENQTTKQWLRENLKQVSLSQVDRNAQLYIIETLKKVQKDYLHAINDMRSIVRDPRFEELSDHGQKERAEKLQEELNDFFEFSMAANKAHRGE